MNIETVIESQYELEQKMILKGHERYKKKAEAIKSLSLRNEAHNLIKNALPLVSEEISQMLKAEADKYNTKGVNGRPFEWYNDLKDIDPDTLAYIGLNVTFDSIINLSAQTATITQIARSIELENWAKGLKDYDRDLSKRIEKQVVKDHSSQRYRIKAARIIASREGYTQERWSTSRLIKAGAPVFNAVLKVSDLFYTFDAGEGHNNTKMVVGLTEDARNAFLDMEDRASWAQPVYGPMIVPPRPWESFDTGCYYDPALAASVTLVRGATREQKAAVVHQFEKGGMPNYVTALNALQDTPLMINREVFSVLEWVMKSDVRLNNFPETATPPFPKSPKNIDEMAPELVSELRREQKEWRSKVREADANREGLKVCVDTAREMLEFDQFWLPWNFDFRGRMYPIPYFNYHRIDHVKALFMLANGKPLTEETKGWLYIHLANCGDFNKISKKSLSERIDWVEENHDMIMACATDPQGSIHIWTEADKPFQFLACCFEYRKMMEQGDDYVCHLAPAMDGTNSGVQHYAAANLSKEDGFLVNLVPDDKCQDVYQAVADVSNQILATIDSDEARKWLEYGVGRSTVKRNVMTYGYSSVERGFSDQIMEDLMRPLQRDVAHGRLDAHPFGDRYSQVRHCALLAKVNYQAVQQVVRSVALGMEYLQGMTTAVAKESKSVRWQTPSGFPVIQSYTKWVQKKVKIYLWDRDIKKMKRSQVTYRDKDETAIDTRKMKAGIAANFVHSLDSAHMQSTILLALDNGITDFFMIHDSFATTCADTWTMYHCIREAFVDQYQDTCVFNDFGEAVRQRLSDPFKTDLPAIPEKGELDISEIVNSEYCFS